MISDNGQTVRFLILAHTFLIVVCFVVIVTDVNAKNDVIRCEQNHDRIVFQSNRSWVFEKWSVFSISHNKIVTNRFDSAVSAQRECASVEFDAARRKN